MTEKLVEMFRMQKELDEKILKGKPYHLDQMRIALLVELGELMNELPSYFKHWKADPKDDREKALEELVDVWHFVMSLLLHIIDEDYWETLLGFLEHKFGITEEENLCACLSLVGGGNILYFPSLMHNLGFTFDELYEGYLKKNAINHKRQEEGY